MIQPSLFCLVCFSSEATLNRVALNGCPRDVAICEDCATQPAGDGK